MKRVINIIRIALLVINCFLLGVAILCFIYDVVNPDTKNISITDFKDLGLLIVPFLLFWVIFQFMYKHMKGRENHLNNHI